MPQKFDIEKFLAPLKLEIQKFRKGVKPGIKRYFFPAELKMRMLQEARICVSEGFALSVVARHLGISDGNFYEEFKVRGWPRLIMKTKDLGKLPQNIPTPPPPKPTTNGTSRYGLTLPTGVQISGLSLSEIFELVSMGGK